MISQPHSVVKSAKRPHTAYSPDLISMETLKLYLQDIMGQRMKAENRTFHNLERLQIVDVNAWTSIELVLNNLILSTPEKFSK